MHPLRIVWLALAAVAGAALIAGAVWASNTLVQDAEEADEVSPYDCELPTDFEKFPPEKQALELQERVECEAAAAAPHATKGGPAPSAVLFCPVDVTALNPGIYPHQPGPLGRNIVNEALVVSSSQTPYNVFAGSLDDDPEQGRIVVERLGLDPCAANAGLSPTYFPETYILPEKSGAVTLTAIEGDLLAYETASGGKGRFDYTTGEFLSP